jgi:uncharacterized protein (TIGR04222 family)
VNAAIFLTFAELAWLGGWEAFLLRSRWRSAATVPPEGDGVALYELAYLRGGARRVVQCALLRLYADDEVELSPSRGRLRARVPGPAGTLDPGRFRAARQKPRDPVETAILEKLGSTWWPVLSLTRAVAATPAVDDVRTRLVASRRFVPGLPSRALALVGPAGLLLLAGASIPIALHGPLPWLPAVAGLVLLVATARLPGPRPTIRGHLSLNRLRRATAEDDASGVARRGVRALEKDDPRRSLCPPPPAPAKRRRPQAPREWDPDTGNDFIDRWLLRDLRTLVQRANHGGLYGIEGISAFWSDPGHHHDGGHHSSGHHDGHDGGAWGGGDFSGGGHHG